MKCRPPGNRDPQPEEIEACQAYLFRQVELIEPRVVCTFGNFSTKLLRGDPTASPGCTGARRCADRRRATVRLYPLFHPAAALYTPAMLETLRADFARIPELLALPAPEQPPPPEPGESAGADSLLSSPDGELAAVVDEVAPEPVPADLQLGLF